MAAVPTESSRIEFQGDDCVLHSVALVKRDSEVTPEVYSFGKDARWV